MIWEASNFNKFFIRKKIYQSFWSFYIYLGNEIGLTHLSYPEEIEDTILEVRLDQVSIDL